MHLLSAVVLPAFAASTSLFQPAASYSPGHLRGGQLEEERSAGGAAIDPPNHVYKDEERGPGWMGLFRASKSSGGGDALASLPSIEAAEASRQHGNTQSSYPSYETNYYYGHQQPGWDYHQSASESARHYDRYSDNYFGEDHQNSYQPQLHTQSQFQVQHNGYSGEAMGYPVAYHTQQSPNRAFDHETEASTSQHSPEDSRSIQPEGFYSLRPKEYQKKLKAAEKMKRSAINIIKKNGDARIGKSIESGAFNNLIKASGGDESAAYVLAGEYAYSESKLKELMIALRSNDRGLYNRLYQKVKEASAQIG